MRTNNLRLSNYILIRKQAAANYMCEDKARATLKNHPHMDTLTTEHVFSTGHWEKRMELHKPIKKTCPNLAGIDNTVKFLIKIVFDYTVPADIFSYFSYGPAKFSNEIFMSEFEFVHSI